MVNQSSGKQGDEAVVMMARILVVRCVVPGGFLRIKQVLKAVPKAGQQNIRGRKRALRMNQQMLCADGSGDRRWMGMLRCRFVMMRRRGVSFLATVDVRPAFPAVLE